MGYELGQKRMRITWGKQRRNIWSGPRTDPTEIGVRNKNPVDWTGLHCNSI